MEITNKHNLANLIHQHPKLLLVLERFGIQLGIGDQSVEEVCDANGISTHAFITICDIFCQHRVTPEMLALDYTVIPTIISYLTQSHDYFLNDKIPFIQQRIKELLAIVKEEKALIIDQFYTEYLEEVQDHMEYENETVFPYILELFTHWNEGKSIKEEDPFDYSINIYGQHHDDIEGLLTDFKNILIRHLPQEEKSNLRRIILMELFDLEEDLNSHTLIENNILIPLVKSLETNIKSEA